MAGTTKPSDYPETGHENLGKTVYLLARRAISRSLFYDAKMTAKAAPASAKPPRDSRESAVAEGIADAKAGRTVPYEKVRRWLLSWGSDKELPPPKCD